MMKKELVAAVVLTAAFVGYGDVTLENRRARLVIGDDATAKSLVLKATGEELLDAHEGIPMFTVTQERPYHNEIKLTWPNKRTAYPANRLRQEGDRLIVGFRIQTYEAEVAVSVTDDYFLFRFAGFRVKPEDFGAILCVSFTQRDRMPSAAIQAQAKQICLHSSHRESVTKWQKCQPMKPLNGFISCSSGKEHQCKASCNI